MELLKRHLAPILAESWQCIDDEARNVLKLNLAGRRLVDFQGPHGWHYAAVNTGAVKPIDSSIEGVTAGVRQVQSLVEMRVPIELDIAALDEVGRGSVNPDLRRVTEAAEKMARAEDSAIFHGLATAGITGIVAASPHETLEIATAADYPRVILRAMDTLRDAGVAGPYALALGPLAYDELFAGTQEGYPIAQQVRRHLVDGPLVRAPAVKGALVLSMRGGDYELTVGQDLSIGYIGSDERKVRLYLTESFTFRVLEPAAAIHLMHASA